jgi:hypothetical protein
LLSLTLALAAVLAMQWRNWPQPLPPLESERRANGAAAERGEPAPEAALAPPQGKETFANIAERPLFRPQRKPAPPLSAEPEAPPATTEAGTLEGVDLSAVLISPGVTVAWIKDPSAPQLKRLRLGDEHAGWSVKSILADRVVLERQGETNELILRDFSKTQPTSPAAPAPAVPTPAGRPNPAAKHEPHPLQRPPPGAQPPGGDQRAAPPRSPQPRPHASRPPSQQPR